MNEEEIKKEIDATKKFLTERTKTLSKLETNLKETRKILQEPENKIGEFSLIKVLGKGQFGIVHLAKKDDQLYAIKMVRISDKTKQADATEIYINLLLDHPNIVKMYSSFNYRNQICMVFEYSEYGDLQNLLKKNKPAEQFVKKIISDILKALAYCHSKKICHRDIKTENVLVFMNEQKEYFFKLADFGVSQECEDNEKIKTTCGTPYYLAPEIVQKQYAFCDKSDIWAVGILAFKCIADRPPFMGDDMRDTFKKILTHKANFNNFSIQTQQFISRLLQKNPYLRPTAEEALKDPWFR